MKCSFFCTYEFRFESLVVLWRRRVYTGKLQNVSFAKVSNFEYTRLLVQ